MTRISTLLETEGPILYITDHNTKNSILRDLAKTNTFKAITFMHPTVLIEHMFYKAEDHMLHEASVFFDLKPAVVKPWLPYLYTIDLEKTYKTLSLKNLQALKRHLISKNAITFTKHLDIIFKNKTIFVDVNAPSSVLKEALKKLETLTPYDTVEQEKHSPLVTTYAFANARDELAFIAHEVRAQARTTSLSDMRIILHHPGYVHLATATFDMFNIPYHTDEKTALWDFHIIQIFYHHLTTFKGDTYKALVTALKKFQNKAPILPPRLYVKVTQTLNTFVHYNKPIETLHPLIKHTLKNTFIVAQGSKEGIAITRTENTPLDPTKCHFHVGACEGYFPRIKTEDDLLSKAEKTTLNVDTADDINKNSKTLIKALFRQAETVTLTYATASLSEIMYKASFIDELKKDFTLNEKAPVSLINQPYSLTYDLIKTKEAYDLYTIYKEKTDTFKTLYLSLKSHFTEFDNTFTGITHSTKDKIIPKPLKLSFTKLNSYFKCKFQFLMDHLLKVDPQEESIHLDLGNLFHSMFETYLNQDEIPEAALTRALEHIINERKTYTAKELYFLKQSFKTLKDAFSIIKKQMADSDYTVLKTEGHYQKAYDNATLVGIIDKVMARQTSDQTNILLIDYKTGSTTLRLNQLLHGLNVQLLYYVLLYSHNEKHHKVKGFYEQTVMLKPKKHDDLTKDEAYQAHLSLKGFTEDDTNEIPLIDHGALDASFIDKLKYNKNGSLSAHTKTYTEADLSLWVTHLDTLIKNAINAITKGDFTIDPKRDKNKDLSCTYCPYKDICYKSEKDYITYNLPKEKDLNECIKEVHNEMD